MKEVFREYSYQQKPKKSLSKLEKIRCLSNSKERIHLNKNEYLKKNERKHFYKKSRGNNSLIRNYKIK